MIMNRHMNIFVSDMSRVVVECMYIFNNVSKTKLNITSTLAVQHELKISVHTVYKVLQFPTTVE
jgi:hypothetical protein